MNSRFLEICDNLTVANNASATGVLNLHRYRGKMVINNESLLIEGIHQCAVRLGRKTIEGANSTASRVLPVSIKSFKQLNHVELTSYDFHCSSTPFGRSARVKVSVLNQQTQALLAQAEITVAMM